MYKNLFKSGSSFLYQIKTNPNILSTDDSCIKDSPAVLASDTSAFIMPIHNLTESEQYVFAVVVSKEGRQDVMAQQHVTVLPGEPPHLDIR